MAALRGTWRKQQINKALAGRPTLQNQITSLRRQVNSQKPETQFYRFQGNHTSLGTDVEQVNILPTATLIGSTGFRDKVTGDEWSNMALKMKFNMTDSCEYARIICYVPKKSGDRFAPSTFSTVTHPDPSSYWVISDTYVNHTGSSNNNKSISKYFPLKKLKTIYDSNAVEITKGEVVVTVILKPKAGASVMYSYGMELVYNNL